MVALLLALTQTVALTPTDDLWAYPHASDPAKDIYLRVWGVGGDAVSSDKNDASDYSYSLLQWDLSTVPKTAKLTGAKLVLTSIADPKYTEDQAKKSPLQVRAVEGGFNEKLWKYDNLAKFYPEKTIFGTGVPSPWPKEGAEFTISVDLMKGPSEFGTYLSDRIKAGKPLSLALTSALDVTINPDVQTLYKLYSKDAPVIASRPSLVLTFE